MTEKRFRKGKSILTDFPTGAIIDEKTGERYYDGIKPSYISSNELVKILNKLNDESEQLKQELAVYRKIANCRNCDYHNYDWYDDGDEFEVCDKGNDVTEGICKEWREL